MSDDAKGTHERSKAVARPVGPVLIALIMIYLVILSIFFLYGIVQLWPSPASAEGSISASSPVTIFLWTFSISDEARLLLIVAMAGSLGSLVHALRSLYWYLGNRELVHSWLAKYVLLPFVGATLGLVFYLVIRGGFFSPQATVQQTSPFGFAAFAGLAGMFSEQVVTKLKQVVENLLTTPPKGEDASRITDRATEKKESNTKG